MHAVQLAFAQSTQTVFDAMGAILAVTFFIALAFMPRGAAPQVEREQEVDGQPAGSFEAQPASAGGSIG
jgi:hypothetical protein